METTNYALNESSNLQTSAPTETKSFLVLSLFSKEIILNDIIAPNGFDFWTSSHLVNFSFIPFRNYKNGVLESNFRVLLFQMDNEIYSNGMLIIERDFELFFRNQFTQSNVEFTIGNDSMLMTKKWSLSEYIFRTKDFLLGNVHDSGIIIPEIQSTQIIYH